MRGQGGLCASLNSLVRGQGGLCASLYSLVSGQGGLCASLNSLVRGQGGLHASPLAVQCGVKVVSVHLFLLYCKYIIGTETRWSL